MAFVSSILCLLMFATSNEAFLPSRSLQIRTGKNTLHTSAYRRKSSLQNYIRDEDSPLLQKQIKDLLTQRAVQTQLFYFDQYHDKLSLEWLEHVDSLEGLSHYHGLHALRHSWEEYLLSIMMSSPVTREVVRPLPQGGTPGNPYLQQRVQSFNVSIEPKVIADNILTIREQLAHEWEEDLLLMEKENNELWRHHFAMVNDLEDRAEALQLPTFEHDAGTSLSSPLRGGSFDLLMNAATVVAVHSLLRSWQSQSSKAVCSRWLRQFWVLHGSLFSGDYGYGSAKKFVSEMLAETPSICSSPGGEMDLIDPLNIAQEVMDERVAVCKLWAELLQSAPEDRWTLQRHALDVQFSKNSISTEWRFPE